MDHRMDLMDLPPLLLMLIKMDMVCLKVLKIFPWKGLLMEGLTMVVLQLEFLMDSHQMFRMASLQRDIVALLTLQEVLSKESQVVLTVPKDSQVVFIVPKDLPMQALTMLVSQGMANQDSMVGH